jgi:hypothetical protein
MCFLQKKPINMKRNRKISDNRGFFSSEKDVLNFSISFVIQCDFKNGPNNMKYKHLRES